jgi:hypothetical protein
MGCGKSKSGDATAARRSKQTRTTKAMNSALDQLGDSDDNIESEQVTSQR